MGVFHISGLGFSPGAVTVPLSCVYCLLKLAYENNDQRAKEFFSTSGELSGNEQYAGKPQGLIIISTEEMFTHEANFSCRWFGLNLGKNNDNINVIRVYLERLTENLQLNYQPLPLEYFCGVKINSIYDLDEIFLKTYITMRALRDKEVWINLVAGANQINLILVIAASLALASTRFYYVFDWDETQGRISNSLHPTWFNFRNTSSANILSRWLEFPPVMIGWSEVIRNLMNIFTNREVINIAEIRNLLQSLGYDPQRLIPKLRGIVLSINGEETSLTQMFKRFVDLASQAESQNINNLSDLLRWDEVRIF